MSCGNTEKECLCHDITSRLVTIGAKIKGIQKRVPMCKDQLILHDLLDEAYEYIDLTINSVTRKLQEKK